MKRLMSVLLILPILILCLAGCNETDVDNTSKADESSQIITENSTVSSLESVPDETSSEEISSEESYYIPEFESDNVLYCDLCDFPPINSMNSVDKATIEYGLDSLGHNRNKLIEYMNLSKITGLQKDEVPENAYFCVAFCLHYTTPEEKFPEQPLKDYLEKFGYIEDEDLTAVIYTDKGYIQTTVGYVPYSTFEAINEDCKNNNYLIFYTWLSKDCLDGECVDFE